MANLKTPPPNDPSLRFRKIKQMGMVSTLCCIVTDMSTQASSVNKSVAQENTFAITQTFIALDQQSLHFFYFVVFALCAPAFSIITYMKFLGPGH